MNTLKLYFILIFLLVFSVFFYKSSAQENPCLTCHVSFKQPAKNVHAVLTMGCETCHTKIEGKEHPQQKNSIKLSQDMPYLCYSCHDESNFRGPVIHSPIAGGICTSCHNPHQSNFNKILKSDIPELCYMCHDKTKFNRKNIHLAITTIGCGTCHAPHVSNYPSLLPSNINDLCLRCHVTKAKEPHVVSLPGGKRHPIGGVKDPSTLKMIKIKDPKNPEREIEAPDPNIPGKDLSCTSCHDPHSSDFKSLLTAERICIKCHKY